MRLLEFPSFLRLKIIPLDAHTLMDIWVVSTLWLGFPGGSDDKKSAFSAGDQVRSLCQKDPLEKGMVSHSSILAWRIP